MRAIVSGSLGAMFLAIFLLIREQPGAILVPVGSAVGQIVLAMFGTPFFLLRTKVIAMGMVVSARRGEFLRVLCFGQCFPLLCHMLRFSACKLVAGQLLRVGVSFFSSCGGNFRPVALVIRTVVGFNLIAVGAAILPGIFAELFAARFIVRHRLSVVRSPVFPGISLPLFGVCSVIVRVLLEHALTVFPVIGLMVRTPWHRGGIGASR